MNTISYSIFNCLKKRVKDSFNSVLRGCRPSWIEAICFPVVGFQNSFTCYFFFFDWHGDFFFGYLDVFFFTYLQGLDGFGYLNGGYFQLFTLGNFVLFTLRFIFICFYFFSCYLYGSINNMGDYLFVFYVFIYRADFQMRFQIYLYDDGFSCLFA